MAAAPKEGVEDVKEVEDCVASHSVIPGRRRKSAGILFRQGVDDGDPAWLRAAVGRRGSARFLSEAAVAKEPSSRITVAVFVPGGVTETITDGSSTTASLLVYAGG